MAYQFDVIETPSHRDFINAVEKQLAEGWELHGVLICLPNHVENGTLIAVRYIQALKKEIVAEKRRGSYLPNK